MDRRDWCWLAGLLASAAAAQAAALARAVSPALDAVQNAWLAQSIERVGLVATLRAEYEQPLFPIWAWVTHRSLSLMGNDAPWAVSLSLASSIPMAACVLPLYFLWRPIAGRGATVVSCLFFCVLPRLQQLGADGTSDTLHLFMATSAVAVMSRQFGASPSTVSCWRWPLVAGVFTSFALLTRSEALALVAGVCVTCASRFFTRGASRGRYVFATVVFIAGLSPALALIVAMSGDFAPRDVLARMLGRRAATETAPLNVGQGHGGGSTAAYEVPWQLDETRRMVFSRKDHATSNRFEGTVEAVWAFARELAHLWQHWVGALVLVGVTRAARRGLRADETFLLFTAAAFSAMAITHAITSGYLAARHLALLAPLWIGFAAEGATAIDHWLRDQLAHRSWHWPASLAGSVTAVLAIVACLPALAGASHVSRAAHRQAAAWLAERAGDGVVLDSLGLTALYTRRVTYRYEAAQAAFCDPRLAFVVVEECELSAATPRGETLRRILAVAAQPAARFAAPAGHEPHTVNVFVWQPQLFAQARENFHAR